MRAKIWIAAAATACMGVSVWAVNSALCQSPKPPTQTEKLPPEAIPIVCLGEYVVTQEMRRAALFCDHQISINASKQANPNLPEVVPPKDAFADFVMKHAAPDARVALYRKGRHGKMVAVRGTDGKVRVLFDYRGLRDADFAAEVSGGASLPLEQEGGFLSIQPPAEAAELTLYNPLPDGKKLLLGKWKLDGAFADRERLLR